VNVPTFLSSKPSRRQCREDVGATQCAEALPDVRPLHLAAEQLPEMTEGQVNVHGGDDHRRERVQDEGG
jgi:hypothetical protein